MHSQKNAQSVILSCHLISKKFGELEILNNVSFTILDDEKIGLVGPNGSGKSTLLKIIANLIEKDEGTVTHSKNTTIEYLPQVHSGLNHLSGGEAAKKVLAPIISSKASLFLLDEPTNNLDTEGLEKVETFIQESKKAFLIVSHDRAFLDKTVSKIIDIDPLTKSIRIYDGNYSDYSVQRRAFIDQQWKHYSDKVEKVGKFTSSIDQRIGWMNSIEQSRKNIRYLPMHEKEKPEAAILRDKEAKAGRRMRIMKDRLQKYKEESATITKPAQLPPLHIEINSTRGSTKVFELLGVEKHMGKMTLGPIDFSIQYGDRVHISGNNGTGKTTLLKLLVGEQEADSGTIIRGDNVTIGYIPQNRGHASSSETTLQHFIAATHFSETNARKLLNRFRITTEDIKKDITLLSPGEYSRLVIAELIAKKPNCIILDEPSNHLDLEILEELEQGLEAFTGTLIVVSHDRYFIEKMLLNKSLNLTLANTANEW